MAAKKKQDKLFGRSDAKRDDLVSVRNRARRDAVSRLCDNADFRTWLFDTLDDLCLFSRDEGLVTDFGQGIRAAANRIRNRLLESPEAVKVLTDFAHKELSAYHAGVAASQQDNQP